MKNYLFSKSSCLCLLLLLINILVYETTSLEALSSHSSDDASSNLINHNPEANTSNSIVEEEYESTLGNQDEEESKFVWRHHQEDHSFYAGRSLISSAKIKNPLEQKLDGDQSTTTTNNNDDNDEGLEALKTVDYAEKEWLLMFRSFDTMYDSVSSSLLQQIGQHTDLFEDIVSKLKPNCRRDIYHIRDSVKKHKLWALRMLDSNGKIPSGVSYGRFSSPGDFEECVGVKVDELVYRGLSGSASSNAPPSPEHYKFRGKYCLIDFRPPLPERPKNKLLSVYEPVVDLSNTEIGKKFPQVNNYSGYASAFYEVGYMHAMCLPSSCDVTDLTKSITKALEGLHITVSNEVDCEQKYDGPQPLRTSQIISFVLLALVFLNSGCASIVHYLRYSRKYRQDMNATAAAAAAATVRNPNDKTNYQGDQRGTNLKSWILKQASRSGFYSECFSIQTNLNRLTKPDPRGLTVVHYTRIVAMALTVITHTAALGTLQAVTKPADASNSEQIFRDFLPQMLTNAFTSIQIFFFMAGFMLVISTYPSIQREKGHISFIEYAIKRAIRLIPGIAATICINFIWPLFVDGPMLSYFIRLIVIPCESNWWHTLGFLSNYDHVEKMCLRHSYFSASDYQLHLLAFPLLLLLYKQPTLSLFIAGILTVAGFAFQVIMILTKVVLPFMMVDYIDKEAFFNVVHYIHHPTWNHMSAFFYGFIIGYLVVKQIRINLKPSTIRKIWIIISPIGILSVFAPYFWNHYKRPIYKWQMVLYVIFDRFILLSFCAWLSYGTMVLGRKPPAKKQPKTPLSHMNLPDIVSLEQDKNKQQHQPTDSNEPIIVTQQQESNFNSSVEQPSVIDTRRLSSSTGGIPRQRSSPNFLSSKQYNSSDNGDFNTATVRPAISSINVSSPSSHNQDEAGQAKQHQANPLTTNGTPETSPIELGISSAQEKPKPRKRQAPISNVNTLSLILSRLTFQLYLFNMVVLWIDVNNSKYYWFFSYYFIITKAAAIYICSTLLAMVFFITLESPSLTLYIQWVKMRAQARADRSQPSAAEATVAGEKLEKTDLKMSKNQDESGKVSPVSKKSDFDGLCMKMSSDSSGLSRPMLKVIDLSPSDSNKSETMISQTKM